MATNPRHFKLAALATQILSDGSKAHNVQLLDENGLAICTIACLGFTQSIEVRDAINNNASWAEVVEARRSWPIAGEVK